MILRIIIFLVINFAALGIGSYFTGSGVSSEWYQTLNKAPWTPPGWFFGVAWTTIMICFSIYLAYLWPLADNTQKLILLFSIQWVLNVSWNPAFFYFRNVGSGLVIISLLTALIGYFIFLYSSELKAKSLLLAPYFIWLVIATSLNAYVLIKN